MKKLQFLLFVSVLLSLVLSACGAAAATPAAVGGKVDAMPVAFIGVVESITGDRWVINGQTVTVAASIVRDGPFQPGDSVKVEGVFNQDGSFTVSRVEAPSPTDISALPQFGDDNSNDSNTNDANINEANVNDDNGNDASVNDNSNAVNSNDASGVNSNDDNSNSSPSSDDNGNDSNSNDDDSNGNDDNSGDDDNSGSGGDDNGGNSNDD